MPDTLNIPQKVFREPDFIVEESEAEIVITGTDFLLPPLYYEGIGGRNLTIMAYRVVLTQDIIAPGKQVTIVAKIIEATSAITINVSGLNAKFNPVRAADGLTPGAGGAKGKTGDDGQHAGGILLYGEKFIGPGLILKAVGGKGAEGQGGGNGAMGNTGQNSPDRRSPRDTGNYPGYPGGKGLTGGAAGGGGGGGAGGNGGQISIHFLMPTDINLFRFEIDGAPGGDPGKNGQPGEGGIGGNGGMGWYCEWDDRVHPGHDH